MDELLCRKVTKLLLPAIRASVAQSLEKKHSFTQQQIADKLGIVQVAVSKYSNGRYSRQVGELKEYIDSKKLSGSIVSSIVNGGNHEDINRKIDALCNERVLIEMLTKLN